MRFALIGLLASLVVACLARDERRHADALSALMCGDGWDRLASADTTVVFCAPPGFRAERPDRWRRAAPDPLTGDWFSLAALTWPADSAFAGRWPPRLASGPTCLADCATADSIVVFADSVARGVARGETGRVSGGMPGFRRQPMLVWGWEGGGSRRLHVTALASTPATLDSIRHGFQRMVVVER